VNGLSTDGVLVTSSMVDAVSVSSLFTGAVFSGHVCC
jgi:hypothetical protein